MRNERDMNLCSIINFFVLFFIPPADFVMHVSSVYLQTRRYIFSKYTENHSFY